MKVYEYVTTIRSMTKPDKFYTIKLDENKKLSCNCPSWVFAHEVNSKGDRMCKHIYFYLDHQSATRFELIETEISAVKIATPKNVRVTTRFSLLDMD
jgi:predicted nucleic acid-binding Zn finger protein